MPENKYINVRYHVLDKCLKDKNQYFTLKKLAERCKDEINSKFDPKKYYTITERQIRVDLNNMTDLFGAEIVSKKLKDEREHYFRYEDPEFSISKKPLTEEDIANLKSSLFLLQRFGGTHHEEWIHDFAVRIEELPVQKKEGNDHHINSDQEEKPVIVQFDHQDTEGGAGFIIPIYQAIEKKNVLEILYKEFKSEETRTFKISPYLLKQFNRRWFLLCKSEGLDFVTTLPLDRMLEVNPSMHEYVPYPGPGNEPINFFDDIIGVVNDTRLEVEDMDIEVHASLLPYIKTKILHESQKMEKPTEDPDWFSIKIRVKPNYELFSLLLSHGPRLRVIAPESIKNKMKDLILEMKSHYSI